MSDRPIKGRCLCGNIRFRVEGEPIWVGHCHCRSCRRNTGSAVATFVGFEPAQVFYLSGERRFFRSSPGVRRGFCGDCGTPLSYDSERFPGESHLYLSTLDEPERFVPQFHVFYAERISWFHIADDIPRYAATTDGAQA